MPNISDAEICAKCVEIGKSLLNTSISMVTLDLNATRNIGDLARFAVSIKRAGEINKETFEAISIALKIDPRISSSQILSAFEDLSWVDVIKDGRRIKRIDEHIPPTTDILGTLGEMWRDLDPKEIDIGTVEALQRLSRRPYTKESFQSELDVSDESLKIILEYGEQANYMGTYLSKQEEQEMVWSPLYWIGKAESVLRYIEKQDEPELNEIGNLTDGILKEPGVPIEKITGRQSNLLRSGIAYGYFPTVAIETPSRNKYEYIFPATASFNPDPQKGVFEKAQIIVSCIRHGQYHAKITKILYPLSILRAMRNNTMKPHPWAHVQYFLLKTHGIVDIVEDRTRHGKAYRINWIDTPENKFAADIAEQMLRAQIIAAPSPEDLAARQIILDGFFEYSSERRKVKSTQRIMAHNEYLRLMEGTLGVTR